MSCHEQWLQTMIHSVGSYLYMVVGTIGNTNLSPATFTWDASQVSYTCGTNRTERATWISREKSFSRPTVTDSTLTDLYVNNRWPRILQCSCSCKKTSADSVVKHLVPFSQLIGAVKRCLNLECMRLERGKIIQLIKYRKVDASVKVELRICPHENFKWVPSGHSWWRWSMTKAQTSLTV